MTIIGKPAKRTALDPPAYLADILDRLVALIQLTNGSPFPRTDLSQRASWTGIPSGGVNRLQGSQRAPETSALGRSKSRSH